MTTFKARVPIIAVVVIGASLVIIGYRTTAIVDRNASVESAVTAKREGSVVNGAVFTPFESPWQLPELRFMNRKNREISLEVFRGSYVLLNVWATWCAPCREEMPALNRLQEKMGSPDFHVLPLSIDEAHPNVIRKFYEELDIEALYVYHDPTGSAFSKLNLPAIPATILLDRDGRGMGYVVGPVKWDDREIVDEIRSYLSTGQNRVYSNMMDISRSFVPGAESNGSEWLLITKSCSGVRPESSNSGTRFVSGGVPVDFDYAPLCQVAPASETISS